ncbi:hypothetical protein [Anaerosinus massiliensis]|uniref:hypothetical protein n=1 Tax=Massilibacillus massiliensis TaxID=1806837 RepID=UPI000DA637F9|nr:hypothetical protein [Massilibacillus massiliensis]
MGILYGLVGLVIVISLVCWAYIVNKGNAEFELKVAERTPFELVNITDDSITLSCQVAMVNKGKQLGTIMDCYSRHLLPYEQFDGVQVLSKVELENAPREDDYFESILIERNTRINLKVIVKLIARKNQDIRETLKNMVDMPIDVVYQMVTRADWHIEKARIEMKASEVAKVANVTLVD